MRWLLVTSVVCAAAACRAAGVAPRSRRIPCVLITTIDASTALGGNPPKAKPKTVAPTRICTYKVGKKTMTVQTQKVATKAAFDKSAKAIKGVVVPMLGVGADAYSANGTTILVWKNGTAVTIAFVGPAAVRRGAAVARQDRRRPALVSFRTGGRTLQPAREMTVRHMTSVLIVSPRSSDPRSPKAYETFVREELLDRRSSYRRVRRVKIDLGRDEPGASRPNGSSYPASH